MSTTVEKADELLEKGYKAFRAGDNKRCIALTREALAIGRQLGDDDITGRALMGLCRAALRDGDEEELQVLSRELVELAERTGDDRWRMVRAHMNAEMARMREEYDRANELYNESMRLSESIGNENMVAAECFNKSFVAVAQGNLAEARVLVRRHFSIRDRLDEGDLDPYGLIAVANLLAAEGRIQDAAQTTYVCRRLFAEKSIVPDPADEVPLLAVEVLCVKTVPQEVRASLQSESSDISCGDLVAKLKVG